MRSDLATLKVKYSPISESAAVASLTDKQLSRLCEEMEGLKSWSVVTQ
jgi:hypothetical protein